MRRKLLLAGCTFQLCVWRCLQGHVFCLAEEGCGRAGLPMWVAAGVPSRTMKEAEEELGGGPCKHFGLRDALLLLTLGTSWRVGCWAVVQLRWGSVSQVLVQLLCTGAAGLGLSRPSPSTVVHWCSWG